MTADPRTIAREAIALTPGERDRYIRDACAGDEPLRTRVTHLLGVMDGATIAPEQPDPPGTAAGHQGTLPAAEIDGPHERIGEYRVLDTIGAGAMGVVYLAEQRSPRRPIALKVIRPEAMTESLRERFERETHTLARLQHPAIAQIFDAGSARVDGQECPYFAMELVTGKSIDERAKELPLARRIEMLRQVCAGVEHAHQKGIVHRDLKPANILVDERDTPRILDFGVARALDDQASKREVVGTLGYMSPEQLYREAIADTRADVYALGVILCELVTGERPHDLAGLTTEQAMQRVTTTPPRTPRAIDPAAPRDLDAIAARALAHVPDERYPSAAALAADLDRYLRTQPVDARERTTAYVASRFARRNPGVVIVGAVALLAVIGGAAGITWQAIEATRGWDRAREEAQRVTAVNAFITDMLTSADPETALGEELTVRELLDQTSRTESMRLEDEPGVESVVRLAIAQTYRGLGVLEDAETNARRALEASINAYGERDPSTADARTSLAVILADRGIPDEAEEQLTLAIDALDEALGREHPDTISARGELARIYHMSGRAEEALELWSEALELMRMHAGEMNERTLVLMHNYGSALGALGRYDEAESTLARVVSMRSELFGDAHPQTVGARSMLASVIQKQGRNEEAVEQFRAILIARNRVLGADHHSTYTAMGNLAVALIGIGSYEEADRLSSIALDGYTRTLGPEHAKTLVLMNTRAYLMEDMGQVETAAALYRQQIEIRERVAGGADPETWSSYNNLAMLLMNNGEPGEAHPLFVRLLAMCDDALPADHIYTAIFRNNHAECLTLLGRYDDARRALASSHPVLASTLGADHPRVQTSLERTARLVELDR